MQTQPTIDDAGFRRSFARELAALEDAGRTFPPKTLLDRATAGWSGFDISPAASRSVSPAQLYRDARAGIVAVGKLYACTRCGGRHVSIASGFVVARSGLVVTARHVLDDAERTALGIMTFDGAVHPARAVVAVSQRDDLAVLQVAADDLVPLPLADAEPEVGAAVYVLSHPAGRLFTFSAGIVSRYSVWRDGKDGEATDRVGVRVMTVTAAFGRGSSGGAVLDARGAVVGVALRTRSIHHRGGGEGESPRLQTVLRHCAPAGALWELGLRV